jgi:hypothetical protein
VSSSSPVSPALIDALGLESLDQASAPTFPELLEKLWAMKYQGMVTLHFAGGMPRSVVLSQPVQIGLDTGKGSSA